jgi:hypothetical protein
MAPVNQAYTENHKSVMDIKEQKARNTNIPEILASGYDSRLTGKPIEIGLLTLLVNPKI